MIGFTDQISVTCLKEEVARHTLVHSLYHEVQCSKKECTFEPVYVQVELLASRIKYRNITCCFVVGVKVTCSGLEQVTLLTPPSPPFDPPCTVDLDDPEPSCLSMVLKDVPVPLSFLLFCPDVLFMIIVCPLAVAVANLSLSLLH